MWFDVTAALTEIEGRPLAAPATSATSATPTPDAGPASQVSQVSQTPARESRPSVANVATVATRSTQSAAPSLSRQEPPSAPEADQFEHERSARGDRRTWTGRVVSLDAWRALSEWERHGPRGQLWCGFCGAWVDRETALAHAEERRAEWLAKKGMANATKQTN